MKNITNFLMPLAVLVLLGTFMVSVTGFLVVLMTSVGFADPWPLYCYQRFYLPALSVALPVAGMILFAAILLGISGKQAAKPIAFEDAKYPSKKRGEKEKRLVKAI